MECPYIDREFKGDAFNKPVNDLDLGGPNYVYYEHRDWFGKVSRVQFCRLIGRKTDVFECLNEKEWQNCPHYKAERWGPGWGLNCARKELRTKISPEFCKDCEQYGAGG